MPPDAGPVRHDHTGLGVDDDADDFTVRFLDQNAIIQLVSLKGARVNRRSAKDLLNAFYDFVQPDGATGGCRLAQFGLLQFTRGGLPLSRLEKGKKKRNGNELFHSYQSLLRKCLSNLPI